MGRYRWLHTDIPTSARLALIADFSIAEILSAPGHATLRQPASVIDLADALRAGKPVGPWDKPILIGIFTRPEGDDVALTSVECLDGHHRLLAGLAAGSWKLLGDIPLDWLDARVNGWPEHASGPEERWIPLKAAFSSTLSPDERPDVSDSPDARGPTARISGAISGSDPVFAERDRGVPLARLLPRSGRP